jgi:hypothetical protein
MKVKQFVEDAKLGFDLTYTWIRESSREWVSEHKEITCVGLVLLFVLVSCD